MMTGSQRAGNTEQQVIYLQDVGDSGLGSEDEPWVGLDVGVLC